MKFKILAYNVQGLNDPNVVVAIKNYLKQCNLVVDFFLDLRT